MPIRSRLEILHEFEDVYGLVLLPGLIIFLAVFLFHQQVKRQDRMVETAASAARVTHERERSVELTQLVGFGEALAKAGDIEVLREVVRQYLSQFVGDRRVWALIRTGGKGESLVGGGRAAHRASPALETLADQALELEANGRVRSEGAEIDGYICFPLSVGDATVGVVGVDLGRETGDIEWRRSAGAAAALLAIAVRNVQLVQEIQEHGTYDGLTGCFNR